MDDSLTDKGAQSIFKIHPYIMTSNTATSGRGADVSSVFDVSWGSVLDQLGNYFKADFLNCFDRIAEFNFLTRGKLVELGYNPE